MSDSADPEVAVPNGYNAKKTVFAFRYLIYYLMIVSWVMPHAVFSVNDKGEAA